jgi:hypothetical protein
MDEQTMKLGLLMEAAQSHQRLAEGSLKRLKIRSQDLAEAVREEVHRTLVTELRNLSGETERAVAALQAVGRAANLRITFWTLGITLLSVAIPLALVLWLLPSPSEIHALTAKHAELTAKITLLEQRGARIDLRRCGEGERLCVRVDRKAPAYGERADYLVVGGY